MKSWATQLGINCFQITCVVVTLMAQNSFRNNRQSYHYRRRCFYRGAFSKGSLGYHKFKENSQNDGSYFNLARIVCSNKFCLSRNVVAQLECHVFCHIGLPVITSCMPDLCSCLKVICMICSKDILHVFKYDGSEDHLASATAELNVKCTFSDDRYIYIPVLRKYH